MVEPKKESTTQNFEFQLSPTNGIVLKFGSKVKDTE